MFSSQVNRKTCALYLWMAIRRCTSALTKRDLDELIFKALKSVVRIGPDRIAAPGDYCLLELGKARDRTCQLSYELRDSGLVSPEIYANAPKNLPLAPSGHVNYTPGVVNLAGRSTSGLAIVAAIPPAPPAYFSWRYAYRGMYAVPGQN